MERLYDNKETSNAQTGSDRVGIDAAKEINIMDPDLIPWDILEQVEVFFQYLDQYIIDDIGFSLYEAASISDRAVELPAGILDFLDDFLLVADVQALRFEGTTAYYA